MFSGRVTARGENVDSYAAVGETVMIGSDVTVTVLGVKGNQVRVGVNAPRDVAVHREEIFERIKREEQAAAHPEHAKANGSSGVV